MKSLFLLVCPWTHYCSITAKCVSCGVTGMMPAKNHNLWHKCHHDTFSVLTAAVGALFHHLCCALCACSGLQQDPAIKSSESL